MFLGLVWMKIQVRFAGTMQNLAERQVLWVDLPPESTLNGLISTLQSALPAPFNKFILQPMLNNKHKAAAILVLNNRQFLGEDMFANALRDGDQIVFLPPMEGG
jgi:molybdopterin converting factor small subunit